MFTGSRRYTDK